MIAERFKFGKRYQRSGEPSTTYLAELRRLAETCRFGDKLEEQLRDRFVCGLNHTMAQKQCLTIENPTLTRAVELVAGLEAAEDQMKILKDARATAEDEVKQVASTSAACWRCLKTNHTPQDCRYKGYDCDACGQKGHLRKACKNSRVQQRRGETSNQHGKGKRKGPAKKGKGAVQQLKEEERAEEYLVLRTNAESLTVPPLKKSVFINDVTLEMEVDTGATVTVIPKRLQGKLKIRTLEPFRTKLCTGSGQSLNVCGTADVHVTSNQKTWTLPLVVVNVEVPPLLGRNWIQVLDDTWMPAVQVNTVKDAHCLEGILAECHKLFRGTRVLQRS